MTAEVKSKATAMHDTSLPKHREFHYEQMLSELEAIVAEAQSRLVEEEATA